LSGCFGFSGSIGEAKTIDREGSDLPRDPAPTRRQTIVTGILIGALLALLLGWLMGVFGIDW
jgi:hypothetical protein